MSRREQVEAPARPDSEVRTLVGRAVGGADRIVSYQAVIWHLAADFPPKRLQPHPRVFPDPPRKTFGQKLGDAFLGFIDWVTDPFPWLGDWVHIFRSRKRRIQEKRLKGGWESVAGGLMRANCVFDHHVLVVGERTLSLVYVGRHEAEVAWTAPLEQLTGIQIATWDVPEEHEATLRCHFTDGSWADVKAVGPEWKRFLERLPSHTPEVP